MPALADVLLVLAAPFIGSFLGLVILRLPAGRPILAGRSRCDCGKIALGPRDLVPLLSWVVNSGRCRACARPLDAFYPAVEVAALAIALWSAAVLPGGLAWIGAGLGCILLVLGWIDARNFILPDVLTLPLAAAGIVVTALLDRSPVLDHLIGAAAGYLVLLLIGLAYRRFRGREGLGTGDAKLFAALGAWVGWQGLPTVLLYATLGGLAVAAYLMWRHGSARADRALPFGPFLCAGGWLVWLYGPLMAG
jgi:leader peptidase (prepilin peptidase)/N-methyltransferase